MSFRSVESLKLASSNGNKYIISDCFAVYEHSSSIPTVYQWKDIKTVIENGMSFTIKARNGSTYTLGKDCYPSYSVFFKARAIIAGGKENTKMDYVCSNLIIPSKSLYIEHDIPEVAYIANGRYNTNELWKEFLHIKNKITVKLLWAFAVFIIGILFFQQTSSIELTQDNWWKYALISIGIGVAATLTLYVILFIIFKALYNGKTKADFALGESLTFIVCNYGFAVIEKSVNSICDLIPWDKATSFIETDSMFIIYSDGAAILWLPKRIYSPVVQKKICALLIKAGLTEK